MKNYMEEKVIQSAIMQKYAYFVIDLWICLKKGY